MNAKVSENTHHVAPQPEMISTDFPLIWSLGHRSNESLVFLSKCTHSKGCYVLTCESAALWTRRDKHRRMCWIGTRLWLESGINTRQSKASDTSHIPSHSWGLHGIRYTYRARARGWRASRTLGKGDSTRVGDHVVGTVSKKCSEIDSIIWSSLICVDERGCNIDRKVVKEQGVSDL